MSETTKGFWYNVTDVRGVRRVTSPEELWMLALLYFDWCSDNPIYESVVVKFPLHVQLQAVPKARAMTLKSFYVHAGVTPEHYAELRDDSAFTRCCEIIESIIFDQKFTSAAAGVMREGLIARELGLGEKVDHTSSDGSMASSKVDPALVESLTKKLMGD